MYVGLPGIVASRASAYRMVFAAAGGTEYGELPAALLHAEGESFRKVVGLLVGDDVQDVPEPLAVVRPMESPSPTMADGMPPRAV